MSAQIYYKENNKWIKAGLNLSEILAVVKGFWKLIISKINITNQK